MIMTGEKEKTKDGKQDIITIGWIAQNCWGKTLVILLEVGSAERKFT